MQIISSTIQELLNLKDATDKFFRSQREEIKLKIENLIKQNTEIVVPELIETKSFLYEEFIVYNNSLIDQIDSYYKKVIDFSTNFSKFYKPYHEFNEDQMLDFKGNANMDNNLYFFRTGTKNLVKFDVTLLSLTEIQANINENQGSLGAACQLPGNKFFHYGGFDPYNTTGYIIDLIDYSLLSVPPLRVVNHASATYFEKEVYIFRRI
ncbi:hypothetical protein SteCoe_39865 [Stentor coeruleus]|uniref:Uncharacterized protein n=1 Tax=Stentor coeruleus TaxID=5963 RepID=A0A1R2AKF5_9CILI|nr:hypothetical protein SteCoe_39865 [Stentor coeruleus]